MCYEHLERSLGKVDAANLDYNTEKKVIGVLKHVLESMTMLFIFNRIYEKEGRRTIAMSKNCQQ